MQGMTTAIVPPKRQACSHDSTRLDGLLDNCCLRCGADGYWRDGGSVDPAAAQERELHPSGKMLLRVA